jgi:hypothetical protein
VTCRSPEKVAHKSRDAALEAIRKLYKAGRGNPDYSPYPCGGHWHVGHEAAHFRKRIKAALGSGRNKATNRRTKR